MFDIGWGKLVIIGLIALLVIGPKELPAVLRTLGQWMTKIRRMAAEFQGQFQEAMREAEMADLKKQVEKEVDTFSEATRNFTNFDPLESTRKDLEGAVGEPPSLMTATDTKPPAPDTPPADAPPAPAAETVTAAQASEGTATLDIPLPEPAPPVDEKDFATAAPSDPTPVPAKPEGGRAA